MLALGILCALAGISIMYGVTLTEQAFSRSRVPVWLRPAIGGLVLGGLACVTPAVLSAGHGALRTELTATLPLATLLMLLGLKAAASAISLGSGFRGGLFFASLFLGAMLGKAFAATMLLIWPVPVFPDSVYGLIGMSGMAVAIVGGPLTMTFLALESTGSLPLTVAVLAASRRLLADRAGAPSATRSPPGASTCAARAYVARSMSAGYATSLWAR